MATTVRVLAVPAALLFAPLAHGHALARRRSYESEVCAACTAAAIEERGPGGYIGRALAFCLIGTILKQHRCALNVRPGGSRWATRVERRS